jgi:hypothetical protein
MGRVAHATADFLVDAVDARQGVVARVRQEGQPEARRVLMRGYGVVHLDILEEPLLTRAFEAGILGVVVPTSSDFQGVPGLRCHVVSSLSLAECRPYRRRLESRFAACEAGKRFTHVGPVP